MTNKTVEITVKQSTKVVLIAKLLKETPEGFYFRDEIKNDEFALRREDVVKIELL